MKTFERFHLPILKKRIENEPKITGAQYSADVCSIPGII